MKIFIDTVDSRGIELDNITELCITQTAGVSCDSLCVRFKSSSTVGEIVSVKAYDGRNLIFNGYCDNQRIYENEKGFETYFYARSTASVLVDNEAEPFTYNKPTARQLWFIYAKPYGFTCNLPVITTDEKYEIAKGTSCFGAIGRFVNLKTSKSIYVTPDNSIELLEASKDVKSLNDYNILSSSFVINRSEPLTKICFKRRNSEVGYNLTTKAEASLGFNERKEYLNLSSLPQWQRENAVLQRLKGSYADYNVLEVVVAGSVTEDLYQRFSYHSKSGDFEDYILNEKRYVFNEKGESTRLILKRKIDIKEITYVD